MIESALFDLYGTIIPRPDREEHENMLSAMADLFHADRGSFAALWNHTSGERTTGKGGSARGFMEYLVERGGLISDESSIEWATALWRDLTTSLIRFFPDVMPTFERLKEEGIKIGILTNCGSDVPLLIRKSEIGPLLDVAVFSTIEGLKKPDPRIYLRACSRIGSEVQNTIFIGDGDSNELSGAGNAGLFPIKIQRGDSAGNYRLMKEEDWNPTIIDLRNIFDIIHSV